MQSSVASVGFGAGSSIAPLPAMAAAVEWLVAAAASGVFGLIVGALLIPLVHNVAMPAVAKFRGAKKEHA